MIDFGDSWVTDFDHDFYYLLEELDEELGRGFDLKVMKYYGYEDISKGIRKSNSMNLIGW